MYTSFVAYVKCKSQIIKANDILIFSHLINKSDMQNFIDFDYLTTDYKTK